MNANTSVGLGYSELIDSHRAGLQMERSFLTKSTWAAQDGGRQPSSSPFPALCIMLEDGGRWVLCLCVWVRKREKRGGGDAWRKKGVIWRLKCPLPLQLIDTFKWLEKHCFQGLPFKHWASQGRKTNRNTETQCSTLQLVSCYESATF